MVVGATVVGVGSVVVVVGASVVGGATVVVVGGVVVVVDASVVDVAEVDVDPPPSLGEHAVKIKPSRRAAERIPGRKCTDRSGYRHPGAELQQSNPEPHEHQDPRAVSGPFPVDNTTRLT